MSAQPIRIGYVPEHYLLPLHLCKSRFPFPVEIVPFPSGTGHMITSLRAEEIDLAIGLTEGWVAGLLTAQGQREQGYAIVGSWVKNPLRWSIVTGRHRDNINNVADLAQHRRVGVSRMGSGSHVMAFVLAQDQGWLQQQDRDLTIVPLGPFKDLRDGVAGDLQRDSENNHEKGNPKADFFMWEHFTTKPYFHDAGDGKPIPLKWVGEIYTPWPSWHVAASTKTFPDPGTDPKLKQIFDTFDQGIEAFHADTNEAVRLLGTGELGCHYNEDDAREWLKSVQFFDKTRGVDSTVMSSVVKVLQGAGVIDSNTNIKDGDGVVGVSRE